MRYLISFEGIDGCGKSTQINLLKNELENRDISNCILREPGDTSLSDKIREILLDKENNICAESETLLFLPCQKNSQFFSNLHKRIQQVLPHCLKHRSLYS